jgi:hypothetical protein
MESIYRLISVSNLKTTFSQPSIGALPIVAIARCAVHNTFWKEKMFDAKSTNR